MNHHIRSTEGVYGLFEEPLHVCGNRHIRLNSDVPPPRSLDICDNCFVLRLVFQSSPRPPKIHLLPVVLRSSCRFLLMLQS